MGLNFYKSYEGKVCKLSSFVQEERLRNRDLKALSSSKMGQI